MTLTELSNQLAEFVAGASAAVLQVRGGRRPASGVVHGTDTIITSARALGREDGLGITLPGGETADVDLAGWDPASGLAVLRTRSPLQLQAAQTSVDEPRSGALVVPLARSWSNKITASPGFVATVGGPLRTGRRRHIARVFRITAPVHDGFAGGGVFDASGRLAGITTAAAIRGFAVCIPTSLAWEAAARILTGGTPSRGFLGVGVHPVALPPLQAPDGRERALLITSVSAASPAQAAGLMVGDVLLDFDGQPLRAPDDLLDLLNGRKAGEAVAVRTLRGKTEQTVTVTIAERARQ